MRYSSAGLSCSQGHPKCKQGAPPLLTPNRKMELTKWELPLDIFRQLDDTSSGEGANRERDDMSETALAMETLRAEYLIPGSNLTEFTRKVGALNKRARRLGVTEITFTTAPAYRTYEYRELGFGHLGVSLSNNKWIADRAITFDENGSKVLGESVDVKADLEMRVRHGGGIRAELTGNILEWLHLTVEGEAPKYAGWILTAVLEPLDLGDEGVENIIKAVPGHTVPAEYRDRVGECDHCHTKRKRNETFVVKHEERGEEKMVGRNCIADFLGHTDPHRLANLAEWMADVGVLCGGAEDEGWLGGGGRVASAWDLEHFLCWTSAIIRADGWTSKGAAFDKEWLVPTVSTVLLMVGGKPKKMNESEWRELVERYAPDAARIERARAAAEWAANLNAEGEIESDYLYNVNLIARAGHVTGKTAGLAASIVSAHARAEERELEKAKRAKRKNEWYGDVGDKIEIAVRCERVIEIPGEWGVTGLHKMRGLEGRSFDWFSSSAEWMDEGEICWISGRVKKHEEYRGWKTTMLTRVKLDSNKEAKIVEALEKYAARIEGGKKLTKPMTAKRDRMAAELAVMRAELETLRKEYGDEGS